MRETYLSKESIHEAIPALNVDGDVVRSDIIIVALRLKINNTWWSAYYKTSIIIHGTVDRGVSTDIISCSLIKIRYITTIPVYVNNYRSDLFISFISND